MYLPTGWKPKDCCALTSVTAFKGSPRGAALSPANPTAAAGAEKPLSALIRHRNHFSFDTAKNKPGIHNTGEFYLNTTQLLAQLVLITYYERKFILESGNFSVKNLHPNKGVTALALCT